MVGVEEEVGVDQEEDQVVVLVKTPKVVDPIIMAETNHEGHPINPIDLTRSNFPNLSL